MFNMEILTGAESMPGMVLPRVLMGLRYREQSTLLFKRFPALAVSDADARRFAATGEISFQASAGRRGAARAGGTGSRARLSIRRPLAPDRAASPLQ